jgi:hypothetical protein
VLIASTFLPIEEVKVPIEKTFLLIDRIKMPIVKVSRKYLGVKQVNHRINPLKYGNLSCEVEFNVMQIENPLHKPFTRIQNWGISANDILVPLFATNTGLFRLYVLLVPLLQLIASIFLK